MRFMVLVKADKNSEAGILPDEKLLRDMGNYNDELTRRGCSSPAKACRRRPKEARQVRG